MVSAEVWALRSIYSDPHEMMHIRILTGSHLYFLEQLKDLFN